MRWTSGDAKVEYERAEWCRVQGAATLAAKVGRLADSNNATACAVLCCACPSQSGRGTGLRSAGLSLLCTGHWPGSRARPPALSISAHARTHACSCADVVLGKHPSRNRFQPSSRSRHRLFMSSPVCTRLPACLAHPDLPLTCTPISLGSLCRARPAFPLRFRPAPYLHICIPA